MAIKLHPTTRLRAKRVASTPAPRVANPHAQPRGTGVFHLRPEPAGPVWRHGAVAECARAPQHADPLAARRACARHAAVVCHRVLRFDPARRRRLFFGGACVCVVFLAAAARLVP